ncbi:MAG: carbohydrate ABC transporter permease, partial [Spirochaetales bacterium]|nr:carbohydrate ABC transporter permease [Spirochaetales bacterium]
MRKRVQRRPFDTFKYILRKVILLLLAIIVAFPLLYMFSSSFFSPKDFNNLRLFTVTPRWSNYAKALGHGYFGSFILNSIGTSVLAALIRTCVVVLAAFAFTHLRFRGKNLILGALVLTLFVPQEAILYQNYKTVATLGM